MADETTEDEATAQDGETIEEKPPEEPVSKVKEWGLAVVIMIFFGLIFWGFTSFLRPG